MKVKVQHVFTVELHAVGAVEFKGAFLDKVTGALHTLGKEFGADELQVTPSGKCIIVDARNISVTSLAAFRDAVVRQTVLLAEHGPDADLLSALIDRYPELRNHPRLPSLVSSFENMTGVLQEILGDEKGTVLAEIRRRTTEGITLVEEDLKASTGRRRTTMRTEDRAAFRDAAILGQTPEQVEAVKRSSKPTDAGVPDVYDKVKKQQDKEVAAAANGTDGNVFTRPAKGSKA